jgi:hypothetical protein
MTFRSLIGYLILLSACSPSFAQVAHRYDVVIDELFPDPTPVIGLPDAEFIELKNISSTAFNLYNWQLSDGTSTATIKTNFILQPDSFVVICSTAALTSYANFGAAIGVTGFPSLNNDGDIISLLSPEGLAIHIISYNKTWYQNEVKSDGGWTLEMIDTKMPCLGYNNWKASTDPKGGTPGQKNTADGNNTDEQPPSLLRTYTIDSMTIVAVFDKSLDSNTAASSINYQLDKGIGNPVSVFPQLPLFNEVILKLPLKLDVKTVYQLTVNNITDCAGNAINMMNTAKAGLPVPADSTSIVINEILFNPKSGGYDYAEIYNRSDDVVDLKQLYIANRDAPGSLTSLKQLSTSSYLFFPGEYFAFTENSQWVQDNYVVKHPDKMIELPALPSLPDDNGSLVLVNQLGNTIDELHYDHKWHLPLIADEDGVALERIDYNQPTQNQDNWTSAASTSGFGTPTYQNSEFMADAKLKAAIDVTPKLFSPDNDGNQDFCFINYQVSEPGNIANISIFDASGRPVRFLIKNATLGLTGNFRWDGLDDTQRKLPIGMYIVFTEVFNLQGKTKQYKNVVTLAGKL